MSSEKGSDPTQNRKLDTMHAKTIVITARSVDVKTINKLLLSLRDWEFGNEPIWDDCQILRTRAEFAQRRPYADKPPLTEYQHTEFVDLTLGEVESFMLSEDKKGTEAYLFLVLDEQGVKDETIIIASRCTNPDEETMFDESVPFILDEYDKTRVPWMETHVMHCNLAIGNMDFSEFCEENEPIDNEGWFNYQRVESGSNYEGFTKKRDAVLHELAKLDLA